jgi:diadenosine tetraphosphate (Ap4A) HIT family hydrolase
MKDYPFCRRIAAGDVAESNKHVVAFAYACSVASGHTLVIPRRPGRASSRIVAATWLL